MSLCDQQKQDNSACCFDIWGLEKTKAVVGKYQQEIHKN